jgi:hypothetical protein
MAECVQQVTNANFTFKLPIPRAKASTTCSTGLVLPAVESAGECLDQSTSLEIVSCGLDGVHDILLNEGRV